MTLEQKIKILSSLNAPAGFEDEVTRAVCEMLSPATDSVSTDAMGNIIAYKRCGKPDARLLMLTAHMDEIGFIVTGSQNGFLRFDSLGGVDPRQLAAREVLILTDEPLFGVIGVMPPHVLSADEQDKPVDIDKLFIDAGLSDDEAKKRVPPGTPAVFAAEAISLGDGVICGKALDDRACVAALVEAMERLREAAANIDVCAMVTVQEELGTRGAAPGAYAVNPDFCLALDATFAKTPDSPDVKTFEMGGGPAIGVGPNMDRGLTSQLFDVAGKTGLNCQTEVLHGSSGTDAWPIQISREGVRTALVSLPVKYMHSPVEMLDMTDVETLVELVVKFAETFGEAE